MKALLAAVSLCLVLTQAGCPPACSQDSDCVTFSDYCGGCYCESLSVNDPAPICNGTTVQCFVDPCAGKTAVCDPGSHTCAIKR